MPYNQMVKLSSHVSMRIQFLLIPLGKLFLFLPRLTNWSKIQHFPLLWKTAQIRSNFFQKLISPIYHHCYTLLKTGWRNHFCQNLSFVLITCKVIRFLKWCKFHEFFLFFCERREALVLFLAQICYFLVILLLYYFRNTLNMQIFGRTHN